jgi:hypothetical protein
MPEPIGDSRLIEMPGHLIRRLHQISFALFLEQAKAFGVTPVQYAALVAINDHPGIDQTTLCNIIAFDRTTIGGVVGRLQRTIGAPRRCTSRRRGGGLFATSSPPWQRRSG